LKLVDDTLFHLRKARGGGGDGVKEGALVTAKESVGSWCSFGL